MTRDVEMELSLWEMLLAVRRHWVIVLISMVVCAALGGALGYVKDSKEANAPATDQSAAIGGVTTDHVSYAEKLYKDSQEMTEDTDEAYGKLSEKLRDEWNSLKGISENHPLMQVDPANVTVDRVTVSFGEGEYGHGGLVSDWIGTADDDSLFGGSKEALSQYKSDLIHVDTSAPSGVDTSVLLVGVDGFDPAKAARYLESWIKSQATGAGVPVRAVSHSEVTGRSQYVTEFRSNIVNRMNEITGQLNNIYQTAITAVAAPVFDNVIAPASGDASGASVASSAAGGRLIKFLLVGFVLGIIVGAALAILITLRQGCIISTRQVEDAFALEMLSDCSKESVAAIDILNANLDVMVGDAGAVMLIGSRAGVGDVDGVVSLLSDEGQRQFIAGRDIIDDSETIDALANVAGILLALRIGESKLDDIQRLMIRAKKLGKQVLGYVVV